MQLFKSLIIVLCLTLPSSAQELTELQKTKAELLKAKIEIAQLKAALQDKDNKIASYELTVEQKKLLDEFRKQLKADEKQEFDWTTLTFKPLPITK